MIRQFFRSPTVWPPRPAVFLDRDGVINRKIDDGYVTEWANFQFLPGIVGVLKSLASLDMPVIVVSNQAGVGKRLVSEESLREITGKFVSILVRAGARIDAVYYCPHTPDANCPCRKPKPGLLEQAAADWRIQLNRSVLIGDSMTDIQAAAAVGCNAILFAQDWTAQSGLLSGVPKASSAGEMFGAVSETLGCPCSVKTKSCIGRSPLAASK